MAHFIQAIIGRRNQIDKFGLKWKNAVTVNLDQDISLIPWSYDLRKEIFNKEEEPNGLCENFEFANSTLFNALMKDSKDGQIGYIETNYFGGSGTQSAILFMYGAINGPYKTETFIANEIHAINQVLSTLGVVKQAFQDEFAALGLMDLRSNEKLLKKRHLEE